MHAPQGKGGTKTRQEAQLSMTSRELRGVPGITELISSHRETKGGQRNAKGFQTSPALSTPKLRLSAAQGSAHEQVSRRLRR
jgi:hypothetical protein